MNEVQEFMGKEVSKLDTLLSQFIQARKLKPKDAKPHLEELRQAIERIIYLDEEILFPVYENITRSADASPILAMLRTEHQRLLELLDQIKKSLDRKNCPYPELEVELVDILVSQIRIKENVLYSWFDESLSKGQRERTLRILKQEIVSERK